MAKRTDWEILQGIQQTIQDTEQSKAVAAGVAQEAYDCGDMDTFRNQYDLCLQLESDIHELKALAAEFM
jgi:hypothetical protein